MGLGIWDLEFGTWNLGLGSSNYLRVEFQPKYKK
jgi:hypothetical protein